MKKKIHKLPLKFDYNFSIIGISSHENGYRLCWAINKSLNFNLAQSDDLKLKVKNSDLTQKFTVYSNLDDENAINYELIACSSENGFLFKKYKNLDYILKISGLVNQVFLSQLIEKLNKIDIVIVSFLIEDLSKIEMKKLLP
ncbi:MAG: IPExxxVDY family protein [Bacteroidota bacterium]|nr:IPExxxVDY family protein [Bacteroidota bacterium]